LDKVSNFIELKKTSKIWAIGSIHSNLKSFSTIKKYTESYFIFIGNDISLKSLRSDKRYKILKYLNFHSKNNNILNSYGKIFKKFMECSLG